MKSREFVSDAIGRYYYKRGQKYHSQKTMSQPLSTKFNFNIEKLGTNE